MLTHIVQIVLVLVVANTVKYAITTWIQDRREERAADARIDNAVDAAWAEIQRRLETGFYHGKPNEVLKNDYDYLLLQNLTK